jgi:hypothetical protein
VRAALDAEMPELPLSYFDAPVPVPDGWAARRAGYVLLSDVYRPDADAARALGWPVVELLGAHLDLVTRPEAVADAILTCAGTGADDLCED